jgi:hypothetical protein
MRYRVPEIFLGVFLSVAIFAMGMTFSSVIFSPNQSTEHESQSEHPKDKAPKIGNAESADDRIAKYTLWLAILTGGLVIVSVFQGYFLIRADRTARIAANAAAEGAEAQIALEGARLTCLPTSSSYWNEIGRWADRWPNSPDMPLRRTFAVLFVLKNYGKTPATITGVNARLIRSREAPGNINIETPFLELPGEIVVGAGLRSEGEFKVEFSQFFRLEEAIQVQNGELNIWFNGRVIYDDVFGRVGTQVFLYKVRPRGGFIPIWDQTTYRQK